MYFHLWNANWSSTHLRQVWDEQAPLKFCFLLNICVQLCFSVCSCLYHLNHFISIAWFCAGLFLQDRTIEIIRDEANRGKVGNNNEIGHGEDPNSLGFKRRQVMNELLETEKVYVKELEAVLRGYIEEMENPDLVSFVPDVLHGKKDVLFANWQELYNFHKSTFLSDIENYRNRPTLIGKCFVKRKEELDRLYSTYCQNKPRSELLRRDCGNNNQFFQVSKCCWIQMLTNLYSQSRWKFGISWFFPI